MKRQVLRAAAVLAATFVLAALSGPQAEAAPPEAFHVYVGTFMHDGKSQGIYTCRLDLKSAALTLEGVTTGDQHPAFLALRPDGRYLYAINETDDYEGKPSGAVSAYAIDGKSGKLSFLNRRSSDGAWPCHLTVDRSGRFVLVASYKSGSVAAFALETDGKIGERTSFFKHEGSSINQERQEAPHAHSIDVDLGNRFVLSADLGIDKVLIYRFDARTGTLAPNTQPHVRTAPGAGPRHIAFHPDRRHAYVINELDSTVTAFAYAEKTGFLNEIQTISTLPADFEGSSTTAEIMISPSGKYLYGSNRGHDSIAVFAIQSDGKLGLVEREPTRGKTPRSFNIDPTGRYLLAANQRSDSIVVFRIDSSTGALETTDNVVEVPSPVCIVFLPVSKSR